MRRQFFVVAVSVLFLAPAAWAAGGWGVRGQMEPSTDRDAVDGYMWGTAPQTPSSLGPDGKLHTNGGKVYFNGWFAQMGGSSVTGLADPFNFNINLAAAQTGFVPEGQVRAIALLGDWVDCNKDGFIGLGDQGLWEYRTEVLFAPGGARDSVCANESIPFRSIDAIPNAGGWRPPHNDGQWVHEFLYIGSDAWRTNWNNNAGKYDWVGQDVNPWILNASDSRVWMDFGLPDDRYTGRIVGGCAHNPAPNQTFHSTGGMLAWADCNDNFTVTDTWDKVADDPSHPQTKQLSFSDEPRNTKNSSSKLNVRNPWGDDNESSYAKVWDCSSNGGAPNNQVFHFPSDTVFGATGVRRWFNVSRPNTAIVSSINPNGKPAGTVNETERGFAECYRQTEATTGPSNGNDPYALESRGGDPSLKRVHTDDWLSFSNGFRRNGPHTQLGWGAPADFGVETLGPDGCRISTGSYCQAGYWIGAWAYSTVNWLDRQVYTSLNVTYYAHVGNEAHPELGGLPSASPVDYYGFKLPGAGVYGAESCNQPPQEQLFECDASLWWPANSIPRSARLGRDPADAGLPANDQRARPYGVSVGQAYELRDIDCYDNSAMVLRGLGVQTMRVDVGEASNVLTNQPKHCVLPGG